MSTRQFGCDWDDDPDENLFLDNRQRVLQMAQDENQYLWARRMAVLQITRASDLMELATSNCHADVQLEAVQALGRMREIDCLSSLMRDNHCEGWVKEQAVRSLSRLLNTSEINVLTRDETLAMWARFYLVQDLARRGIIATLPDILVSFIRDENCSRWVCVESIKELAQWGCYNRLTQLLHSNNVCASVRMEILRTLCCSPMGDIRVFLPTLLSLAWNEMGDLDGWQRVELVRVLHAMGFDQTSNLRSIALDRSIDAWPRWYAAEVLEREIDDDMTEIWDSLTMSSHPWIAQKAIEKISEINNE